MDWGNRITYLAETSVKDRTVTFGIRDLDRLEHMAIIGRSNDDRFSFLTRMVMSDLERGIGTLVLDMSGKLSKLIMERLTEETKHRLIHIDPADGEYPYCWNAVDDYKNVAFEIAQPILSKALGSLYQIPVSSLTDIGADILLKREGTTFLTFYEVMVDESARAELVSDPALIENLNRAMTENQEALDRIKEHGRYIAKDSLVRNLVGQKESKFSMRQLDSGALIIVDFSRIRMFPTRVTPLVRKYVYALHVRSHTSQDPLSLYMNETLRYLETSDIEVLFSKHAVLTCISDTFYNDELKELRDIVTTRSGTIAAFQPNQGDVQTVEKVFYPFVTTDELLKLEEGEFIIALTIDSVRSRPFFARTIALSKRSGISEQDLMTQSRNLFTIGRTKVDQMFKKSPAKQPGKDGAQGNFSDAFRSIFSKRGSDSVVPKVDKAPPTAVVSQSSTPQATQVSQFSISSINVAQKEKQTPSNPEEIPEEELRSILKIDSGKKKKS